MSRRRDRIGRHAPRSKGRRPSLEGLEARELLTGYSVINAADSGDGSLRAAIIAANGDHQLGADTISFAIPGGAPRTIALKSALPAITRTIVIDGTTEPGSGTAPRVVIDGSGLAPGASGLRLTGGGGSIIRGLGLINFTANGPVGGRGIQLNDTGKDQIEGNYIGVAVDGFTAAPNTFGIEVDSPGNTIGGTTAAAMNVISGNTVDGLFLAGASANSNLVQGNRIGTDSSGLYGVVDALGVPASGYHGIDVAAPGNTIGGVGAGQGNLISGNVGPDSKSGMGVWFQGNASGNVVSGNMIGVNVTGKASLGNVYGVYFGNPDQAAAKNDQVSQETIGGDAGNLISGNFIGIAGNTTAALITRNIIGPDITGKAAIPDGQPGGYGMFLGASGSTIGGTAAGAGNVISGNGTVASPGVGVELSGDSDLIQGNSIGTDAQGSVALPNSVGMNLHLTQSTIGGTVLAAANLVSANFGDGIRLDTNGGNLIQGNFIGATAGGSPGNRGNGINIVLPPTTPPATSPLALNDTIGGTAPGAGNWLFTNGGSGIAVANSFGPGVTGLAFRGNSIARNTALGIDLASTGVPTPGYLFITSATPVGGGKTTVNGLFHGIPGVAYALDFFANPAVDPSGFGQGQYYLGSATVTSGPGGIVAFTQTFAIPSIGQPILSATSTDPLGNTSEFSANFPAATPPASADLSIAGSVVKSSVTINDLVTFTETVTNNGTATANTVVLNDALPTSLVNAAAQTTAGKVAIASDNILTANLGSLAPGQSATVTITANASALGALQNTAGVFSTTADPNYLNNQATQAVAILSPVPPSADLSIAQTASTSTPAFGSNVTYTVTVTNKGPSAATNVKVNDFLPAGVTLIGFSPAQATVNGTFLAANLGTIASGASATLTIVVTPTANGTFTNAANVSATQFDPVPGNNSTSLSLTATGAPQFSLALKQAVSPFVGGLNQHLTFTLTVTNSGPGAATGVTLVDALPAGVTYTTSASSQGSPPSVANGFLNAALGTIAPGASATVTLVVVPTKTGGFFNYAGVAATGSTSSVFAGATVNVVAGPSVTLIASARSMTQFVANFNEALDPATASNAANYLLYDLGTAARALKPTDKPLAINSALYVPTTYGVVLTPAKALITNHYYYLVIVGSTAAGIADTYGHKLVGVPGGTPGTDFTAAFYGGGLTKI